MADRAYYAWQVREADGRWGLARMEYRLDAPTGPIVTIDVLIHRDYKTATGPMREMAEKYRQAAGKPMRLVTLELTGVLEEWGGAAHG